MRSAIFSHNNKAFWSSQHGGEEVKEVRQRKKDGTIKKYSVDQNGQVTIKVKIDSKFQEVTDAKSLAEVISNPVQAPAFRQRQNRDH